MTLALPKSSEEILGLEYDWIASDAKGFVALITTAGGGYAPTEFLKDTDAHDRAIDIILDLPATTQASFAPQLPPNLKNTWRMVAERGLFAFDSDPNGGPYRQVAPPITPIHVDELPPDVRDLVRALSLPRVCFADRRVITVDALR